MSDPLDQAIAEAQYWLLAFKEAQAEVERLRAINVGLINARAAAAEVLGRVASKLPVTCCECRAVLERMEATK